MSAGEVLTVDTSDSSNLESCAPWNETESCYWKHAVVLNRNDAVTDNKAFTFKLSSENWQDESEVGIELVTSELVSGSKEYNLTGRYLKYFPILNSLVELRGQEKCFKLRRNLCGADSISFFATEKNLVMTNCQGTLLMKNEYDPCG